MQLNSTEDSATQVQRLNEANNEALRLTEELIAIGTQLNLADIDIDKAPKEEKVARKIIWKTLKGKYKETQARIKQWDRTINILKYNIKMEGSHFGI